MLSSHPVKLARSYSIQELVLGKRWLDIAPPSIITKENYKYNYLVFKSIKFPEVYNITWVKKKVQCKLLSKLWKWQRHLAAWTVKQGSLQHWGICLWSTGLDYLGDFSMNLEIWRKIPPCLSKVWQFLSLCFASIVCRAYIPLAVKASAVCGHIESTVNSIRMLLYAHYPIIFFFYFWDRIWLCNTGASPLTFSTHQACHEIHLHLSDNCWD